MLATPYARLRLCEQFMHPPSVLFAVAILAVFGVKAAAAQPERPGHGATGGKYLEDQGGCDEADYARSGRATADEITAAVGLVRKRIRHPA